MPHHLIGGDDDQGDDHAVMNGGLFRVVPLAVYRAFQGGMPVLVGLFIAARWGLNALGAYTVATSFLAVSVVVADWGSSRLLPREMARSDRDVMGVVKTATAVRLVLTLLAVAAGLVYAVAGDVDADVLPYMIVLAPVALASIVATNSVSARVVDGDLRGMFAAVSAGLVPVVVAAALAYRGDSPLAVVAAYTLGKWIETAVLTHGRWGLQRASLAGAAKVFRLMFPFGASAIMGVIYSRLPVFLLERFSAREELGIVAAAATIQYVLLLVPTAASLFLYPRITVAAMQRDRSALRNALRSYSITCLIVFGGGLALLWLVLRPVGALLDVPERADAFLFLFVAAGFFTTVNSMSAAVLQAVGAESRAAALSLIVIVSSVVVQISFVRAWGMWGALGGIVICELFAMFLLSIAAWRATRAAIHGRGLRATTVTYGEK